MRSIILYVALTLIFRNFALGQLIGTEVSLDLRNVPDNIFIPYGAQVVDNTAEFDLSNILGNATADVTDDQFIINFDNPTDLTVSGSGAGFVGYDLTLENTFSIENANVNLSSNHIPELIFTNNVLSVNLEDIMFTNGDQIIIDLEIIEVSIPTLSQWGIFILFLLMLVIGLVSINERKIYRFLKSF